MFFPLLVTGTFFLAIAQPDALEEHEEHDVEAAYPSVARFLKWRVPDLSSLTMAVLHPLSDGDTLLIVRAAMPSSIRRTLGRGHEKRVLVVAFGAFVIRGGNLHMALGLEEAVLGDSRMGWGGDEMSVQSADPLAVTLTLKGGYGVLIRKATYLLDLNRQEVLARIEHYGFDVGAMASFGDSLYAAVSTDRKTSTIIAAGKGWEAMTTLRELNGEPIPILRAAVAMPDSLVFYGDSVALTRGKTGWSLHPLPPKREVVSLPGGDSLDLSFLAAPLSVAALATRLFFEDGEEVQGSAFLVTDMERNRHGETEEAGIYELSNGHRRLYALPVPSYESFAQSRPQSARWLDEEFTSLEAGIGAFEIIRDTIWFGTTFYDGEGTTGVGAVGSFSSATRSYDLRYPQEIADWSTSALTVDAPFLWIGLTGHPEGADYGGGVLRYDFHSRTTKHFEVPEIVNVFAIWRDTIHAGTRDGIFYLQDERFHSVPLGFDTGGRVTLLLLNDNP